MPRETKIDAKGVRTVNLNVDLKEETYDKLLSMAKENESIEDIIRRLIMGYDDNKILKLSGKDPNIMDKK